ncbi:hypothetical protein D3C78_1207700 [compost metagenome]
MNSHAAFCSSSDLLFKIHKLAPPTITPPSPASLAFGRKPVPTSNLPATESTIPRSEAVESKVIAICPAANAFFVSSVLRPKLSAFLLSTSSFHQVNVLSPVSLFSKDCSAAAVRPLPLFTYSAP